MKEPVVMHRLSEKTIARALYYVRAEIIRDGLDGQDHVDALLTMRGHDPERYHVPRKVPKKFGRGRMKRAMLDALRERPYGAKELAERVGGEWLSVQVALSELKKAGLVRREGRVWIAKGLDSLTDSVHNTVHGHSLA